MNVVLQTLKNLSRFPLYALLVIAGLIDAVSTEAAPFLYLSAGVIGVLTIGWWILCPLLVCYASLSAFSSLVNALVTQVNFLARVHRDNA